MPRGSSGTGRIPAVTQSSGGTGGGIVNINGNGRIGGEGEEQEWGQVGEGGRRKHGLHVP